MECWCASFLFVLHDTTTKGFQWRFTDVTLCTTATGLSSFHSVSCGLLDLVRYAPGLRYFPTPELIISLITYYAVIEVFTCFLEFTTHGITSKLINTVQLTPFITSMLSITLVLNVIATCTLHLPICTLMQSTANLYAPPALVVYKIWSIEHHAKIAFAGAGGTDTTRLRRAMHIVIESGLMYTVSVVILFILYLASNNAQYAVSDCVSPLLRRASPLSPPPAVQTDQHCASSRLCRSSYAPLIPLVDIS